MSIPKPFQHQLSKVQNVGMRRLVVPVVTLALVLIPRAASALCTTEPFDQAVGRSDAVLVGTIVSARSLTHRIGPGRWGGHGGVLVRIDVEDVLKGSAEDGEAFTSAVAHRPSEDRTLSATRGR
jgi:hypothetical protein